MHILNLCFAKVCAKKDYFGSSNGLAVILNFETKVTWKSLSHFQRELLWESVGERISKIGIHLLKL